MYHLIRYVGKIIQIGYKNILYINDLLLYKIHPYCYDICIGYTSYSYCVSYDLFTCLTGPKIMDGPKKDKRTIYLSVQNICIPLFMLNSNVVAYSS